VPLIGINRDRKTMLRAVNLAFPAAQRFGIPDSNAPRRGIGAAAENNDIVPVLLKGTGEDCSHLPAAAGNNYLQFCLSPVLPAKSLRRSYLF